MALESLQDLYLEQLRDLHSAERQIIAALPKMVKAAKHPELRQAFESHLNQTKAHLQRLEQVGKRTGQELSGHKCEGMEGLLKEGARTMEERADSDVLDAALIASAQRVEHYEMAGYGCARTYARLLGLDDDVRLLQQTLDEEGQTDHLLTSLAEVTINPDALTGDREVRRSASADVGSRSSTASRDKRGESETTA